MDTQRMMVRPHERRDFDTMVRAGLFEVARVHGERDGVLYVTVRRAIVPRVYQSGAAARKRPAWIVPASVAGGMVAAGVGLLYLVSWAISSFTSAVTQSGPALGLVLALAFVLLCVAARRRTMTTTTTTYTRTTTKVKVR